MCKALAAGFNQLSTDKRSRWQRQKIGRVDNDIRDIYETKTQTNSFDVRCARRDHVKII